MPCSICHKQGHNKLICPQNNKYICKTINYSNINILDCIIGALDCIDNVQNTNMYSNLLTEIKPTTSYIMVSLSSEKETHCGYCSDNDGTTEIDNFNRDKIYITLVPELTEQMTLLEKYIEDGYFNEYELQCHSQCYCGKNNIKNNIISLELNIM
jgi:hypothetical protein